MISLRAISPLAHSSRFQTLLRFSFVRDRDLDEIRAKYDSQRSYWQKARMYGHIFQHIGFEGFRHFRKDVRSYFKLRFKKQLNHQEKIQLARMRYDIVKTGPLVIIQILPFSGPLFLLYMYTYPESIPSWFIVDTYYNQGVIQRRQAQQQAIKYFEQRGITKDDVDLNKFSLEDTRQLSKLLFGYYRDGTRGINKLFKKSMQYFLYQQFSKRMIIKKIKAKFEIDSVYEHIHSSMNLLEKIKWKWDEVVLFQNYHVGQLIQIQQKQIQNTIDSDQNDQEEKSNNQGKFTK